ncbi:MAG: FMN-binding protein [Deltaproteobacteria bacterium]|nr:FMN-binding protein [Deltaproteobacteria bacterium]
MSGRGSDVKAVLAVVVIGAVSAAGLAFVQRQTEGAIKAARRAETAEAVGRVVPAECKVRLPDEDAAGESCPAFLKKDLGNGKSGCWEVFPAYRDDGTLCAIAVKTSSDKGYSGRIEVLAGFIGLQSPETLELSRIYVLAHSETPGLGSLATYLQEAPPSEWGSDRRKVFGLNFFRRKLSDMSFVVKKASEAGEEDVVAITAATISSRAVSVAVQVAAEWVKENLDSIRTGLGSTQEVAAGKQEVQP